MRALAPEPERAAGRDCLWRLRRMGRAGGLAFLAGTVSGGCYVYTPVSAAPTPGTRIAIDLNDRGRVALADSIGASAERIEGLVQSFSDSTYVLRVSSVRYRYGPTSTWSDESLGVSANLVRDVRERRFSRGRTALAAGGALAVLVAFALSRDLLGGGSAPTEPGGGTGGGDDQ